MKLIIKLSPEITIKSRPVRKNMIRLLSSNINKVCKPSFPTISQKKLWDAIHIQPNTDSNQAITLLNKKLQAIPGIAKILYVEEFPLIDLDDVARKTVKFWSEALKNKSFAVRVHRKGVHDFSSVDAERYIGSVLLEHVVDAHVNLSDPDIIISIEIKHKYYFLISKVYKGLSGYPLGSQGQVLSLISGGFDSTVASYLTTRRGLITHFCLFRLGGSAQEFSVNEVSYYLWEKYSKSHFVRFITVPFEGIVKEILDKITSSYVGVVLKRMMLRAATIIAQEMKLPALITGDSVAQVSSQTLTNLTVVSDVTDMMVMRPLITYSKQEIIDLATAIGTCKYSEGVPEYCAVTSQKPTTKADKLRVTREEDKFDFSLIDDAVKQRTSVQVDELAQKVDNALQPIIKSILDDCDIVIDIRHPTEEELEPLLVTIGDDDSSCIVLKVPFYQISSYTSKLMPDQQYLLYCKNGVMSHLQAIQLIQAGYQHIGVYKPN